MFVSQCCGWTSYTPGGIFGAEHLSEAQIGLRCFTAAGPPCSPVTCMYVTRLHTVGKSKEPYLA